MLIEEPVVMQSDQLVQDQKTKVSLDDFLLLSIIGIGSYAKVALVRKKDTGERFALKILKKEHIEKKNQVHHIITERNILASISHPFIIKMKYSFQNDRKLFFALEYCPGGELFNLLSKRHYLSEPETKFYAAQIVLALEHLHNNGVLYRDLKPENVLLDNEGYIKITDFGLSKCGFQDSRKTFSICGTPEYLAPEIIFKMGHSKAVDWWTLGNLIYEMLSGSPPFYSTNREELLHKIKYDVPKIPTHLSLEARLLVEGLLRKDPERRLGGGVGGANEIKQHPWFADLDWDLLYARQYVAPFIPRIQSEIDISNFDSEFTSAPIVSFESPSHFAKIRDYEGFSWNSSSHDT